MFQSLFIYVLPLVFFSFFIKWLLNSTPASGRNIPPSPPKFPILGNLHQLGFYPQRNLRSLAQRYGPLMLLHFGDVPVLVVSSAGAACEIMKTHDPIFSNRPKLSTAEKLLYQGKDVSTAPYGEYWRQMRSICVHQLLSNTRVRSCQAVREEETALLVKKIEESSLSSLPVNLTEMFAALTNDVICRVALGRKYCGGEEGRKFNELLKEFMRLLGAFYVGDFVPWLAWIHFVNGQNTEVEKIAQEFDEFLNEVVEEHVNNQKRSFLSEECKDFVDVLLKVQSDNTAGLSIDRDNIKALILDMFAAGTDTTYTVLEWAMTELLRHPGVMQRVQNEVRQVANGKLNITESDLERTPYLKAVIKETLRLYPPVPLLVPRQSTQAVKIKGYDIAAGTMVITNAWAIGRDPATWERPEEFWPERFLNNPVDVKGHDFQLIPFGAGRRGCPGALFAVTITETVLANLLNRFDWSLPGGAKLDDLDMTECTGLTIHRKVPLVAVATQFPARFL